MSLPNKGLLLVSIPLLMQLAFLAALAFIRDEQREAQRLTVHGSEVIARCEQAHRLVTEAQTQMRGYALVPAPEFQSAYNEVRPEVLPAYAEVLGLVEDNPDQAERVTRMKQMAKSFLAWTDENMRLISQGQREEVAHRIEAMNGLNQLASLRQLTDEFLGEGRRLDQLRTDELSRATRYQDLALILGGVLALASTGFLLVGFSRNVSSRVGVLIDNTHRLAEGRELAGRLAGQDELSTIDAMFHRMAESIRLKDQENELFVYSVSHDLRSPLVNLQGFSQELGMVMRDIEELVVNSDLPEAGKNRARKLIERDATESIGFIQSAVTRLAAIIDALLRLSRAGRVEYRPAKIEVHTTVNRILSAMNDTMSRKKAEVAVHPLPPCWGDPTAIEQIFANLIGNAVNYLDPARPGKIEVGVMEGCRGPNTTYYVKDNGLGIPESQQSKVFVAFQRLHPDVAPGEGIGLPLVRRVVERHGGRIWLESTPGVGTTFYVSLPGSLEELPPGYTSITAIPGKLGNS